VIYGLGNSESGILMDYGQMVMDDEFAGIIKYTVEGIPVNDETLAVDVIREIGSFHDYLSHEHTFQNMRKHQTFPKLIDRKLRSKWEADGSKSIYDRSWEKAMEIIKTHKPAPLPDSVQENLGSIIAETEKELGIS